MTADVRRPLGFAPLLLAARKHALMHAFLRDGGAATIHAAPQ